MEFFSPDFVPTVQAVDDEELPDCEIEGISVDAT